jgi:hypothetical protein
MKKFCILISILHFPLCESLSPVITLHIKEVL